MRQWIAGAVTSVFVATGAACASDPDFMSPWQLNTDQSVLLMQTNGAGGAQPFPVFSGGVTSAGYMSIDFALNAFEADTKISAMKARYDLFDGFSRPTARLRADLTQDALLHLMSGSDEDFELPLDVTLNSKTKRHFAKVTGQLEPDGSVSVQSTEALSVITSDATGQSAELIFALEFRPSSTLVAEAQPDLESVKPVLRPVARPLFKVDTVVRQARAPTPKRSAKPQAAAEKQLVEVTHKYRKVRPHRASPCQAGRARVARNDTTHLAARSEPGQGRGVLRSIANAIRPCHD